MSEKSYRTHIKQVNPTGVRRDKYNHLDHKYSVSEGFKNNIPVYIIGSHHNLEVIDGIDNIKKSSKCSITKEELTEKVLNGTII